MDLSIGRVFFLVYNNGKSVFWEGHVKKVLIALFFVACLAITANSLAQNDHRILVIFEEPKDGILYFLNFKNEFNNSMRKMLESDKKDTTIASGLWIMSIRQETINTNVIMVVKIQLGEKNSAIGTFDANKKDAAKLSNEIFTDALRIMRVMTAHEKKGN